MLESIQCLSPLNGMQKVNSWCRNRHIFRLRFLLFSKKRQQKPRHLSAKRWEQQLHQQTVSYKKYNFMKNIRKQIIWKCHHFYSSFPIMFGMQQHSWRRGATIASRWSFFMSFLCIKLFRIALHTWVQAHDRRNQIGASLER